MPFDEVRRPGPERGTNERAINLPPAILWLIAINFAVHLLRQLLSDATDQHIIMQFGVVPTAYTADTPADAFTLIVAPLTYQFLHGSWVHLGVNMITLVAFGAPVERLLGIFRFLLFYLSAGIVAALAHVLFFADSSDVVIGASGAISGVFGAVLMLLRQSGRLSSLLPIAGVWIALNVFFGLFGGTPGGGGERATVVAAADRRRVDRAQCVLRPVRWHARRRRRAGRLGRPHSRLRLRPGRGSSFPATLAAAWRTAALSGTWRAAGLSLDALRGTVPQMARTGLAQYFALALLVAAPAGCKPENKFVAPPPPEISVATPLQQTFTPFIEQTGDTVAFNTVDLVARVEGFVSAINYQDGALVKKGDLLFLIDPTTYSAKVKQAEAELASAKAQLVQAQAEFTRQETLLRQNVSAQNTYDQAKAKRDSAAANVDNQDANLVVARANLDYTNVTAPFDGVVTNHLVSVGELVGATSATKLATIVQLDPIYLTFNMSEQDALMIRSNLGGKRLTLEEITKIPLDIGLMNEEGYPHKGFLNYVSPQLDPQTGTVMVRGLFENKDRQLLPGFFARVRVPTSRQEKASLLVPNRVLAEDQAGRYLLVVNKDDIVEQRRVTIGQLMAGNLRVIDSGIAAADRVVLTTNGRAIPGSKVKTKAVTIQPPPAK
jgi:RND family efflux transporter MFP subunit